MMMLEAEHHVGIHGDEAAIAVIGEAAIAGHFRQRLDRLVVEAEIEHGIHHARHRGAAAGAHRDQQRIFGIAERLAGQLADMVERLFDLRLQFLRIGFVVRVEIGADRGRNGEAGRHRQAEIGHLGEIGALAAQQIAQARFAFGLAVAEGEHPFAGFRSRRAAGLAAALVPASPTGFGAGLAGLFFSALRAVAGGAGFARAGADGFDFAAIFFGLATALAMTANNPREGGKLRALHHFGRFRASREGSGFARLHVEPSEQAETDQADEDQVDRDHEIEQPRHDQDQDACDQRP